MPTLVLTPRDLVDTQLLADAARAAGWEVASLTSWRVPADLRPAHAVVYGEPLFCEVVAAELDLALLQAPADWLVGVPERWLQRWVRAAHHQELWVPAEDLAAFNAAIVGPIEVIATYLPADTRPTS